MEIKRYIDKNETNMKSLLSELISYRSIQSASEENAPFGKECAGALETILKKASEMGFRTNNANGYYGTVDYLPENAEDIKLGILCHLDVVPEGKGWNTEPYVLTEIDKKLFGRGVTDDKGPAVSALYALSAIKDLCINLNYGIRIIYGTNEENGSADIEYYKKHDTMPPMVFTPDANYPIIIGEKGMIRTNFKAELNDKRIKYIKGGQVINAVPSEARAELSDINIHDVNNAIKENHSGCIFEVQPKDNNRIVITAKGKSAHASTPENGNNSITALIELLTYITDDKTLSEIRELYPHNDFYGCANGVFSEDEISGKTTQVLSLIDTQNEIITFSTDIRFPICSSIEKIINIKKSKLKNTAITIKDYTGSEPHYTDKNSEIVKSLLNVYEENTGEKGECIVIGGGTYVHEIEGGVAFGVEHLNKEYNIHGANEFVPIDEFKENSIIFAKAIIEICGK